VRFASLSESPADEAAARILAEGIAAGTVTWLSPPPLRSRGWPALRGQLRTVIQHLHYHAEPTTALIVIADTNDSPLHEPAHGGKPHSDCRLCVLRGIADNTLAGLTPVRGRPALRVVIGVATPAIEAWYLCGKPPNPSEQAWLAAGARGYDKRSLKRAAYGTDRPDVPLMTKVAIAEAQRLAAVLDLLRMHFPRGFGAFESGIRAL
jgi:hypothetical protein